MQTSARNCDVVLGIASAEVDGSPAMAAAPAPPSTWRREIFMMAPFYVAGRMPRRRRSGKPEQDADTEDEPSDREREGAEAIDAAAQQHAIAGGVDEGMGQPRQHEYPRQHQKDHVGMARD